MIPIMMLIYFLNGFSILTKILKISILYPGFHILKHATRLLTGYYHENKINFNAKQF